MSSIVGGLCWLSPEPAKQPIKCSNVPDWLTASAPDISFRQSAPGCGPISIARTRLWKAFQKPNHDEFKRTIIPSHRLRRQASNVKYSERNTCTWQQKVPQDKHPPFLPPRS